MKRIAVICERDRAYGRGLCLGIAGAAVGEKDWSLEFVDDLSAVKSPRLAGFDGVIARISEGAMGTVPGGGNMACNGDCPPMATRTLSLSPISPVSGPQELGMMIAVKPVI